MISIYNNDPDDTMKLKFTSKNIILLALCFVIFTIGLSISIQMKKTSTTLTIDAHSSITFVHAQDNDGCVKCHSTPLTGSCTSCHPSPPTTLNNGVLFPHHDRAIGGPLDTCNDGSCHDAGYDIRYVETPNASHSYCNNCHSNDMTHG